MLLSSLKTQLKIMSGKKEFKCAGLITLFYSCINFILVLKELKGVDISLIKDANQAICYYDMNRLWSFFAILYPFLIVLPFATSYVEDCKNQLLPVYFSRCSKKNYYISKLIACFLGTALVIAVPFFLNLLLCNIFLPHNNNTWIGEYQLENYYRNLLGTNHLYSVKYPKMPLLKIFLYSPFLYNLVYLLIFSLFSGLLGSFVLSISFWLKKNKLVLFLPVFVIMRLLQVYDSYHFSNALSNEEIVYTNCNLLDYVVPTFLSGHNPFYIGIVILVILIVIAASTVYAVKNDIRSME